jgi:hypothetical protein
MGKMEMCVIALGTAQKCENGAQQKATGGDIGTDRGFWGVRIDRRF